MAQPKTKIDKIAKKFLNKKEEEKAVEKAASVENSKDVVLKSLPSEIYDVCQTPGTRGFRIVKIKYDIATGEAMIEDHYDFENSIVHKTHDQGKQGLKMMYERLARNKK